MTGNLSKYGEKNAAGLETKLSKGNLDRGQENLHIEFVVDHSSEISNEEEHGRIYIVIVDNNRDFIAFESNRKWELGKRMQQFSKTSFKKGVDLSIKTAVTRSRSRFSNSLL